MSKTHRRRHRKTVRSRRGGVTGLQAGGRRRRKKKGRTRRKRRRGGVGPATKLAARRSNWRTRGAPRGRLPLPTETARVAHRAEHRRMRRHRAAQRAAQREAQRVQERTAARRAEHQAHVIAQDIERANHLAQLLPQAPTAPPLPLAHQEYPLLSPSQFRDLPLAHPLRGGRRTKKRRRRRSLS